MLQFLGVVAPCNDVVVRTDADESLGMGLVQIEVYPLLVDGIASAVLAQRLHVPGSLLKLL